MYAAETEEFLHLYDVVFTAISQITLFLLRLLLFYKFVRGYKLRLFLIRFRNVPLFISALQPLSYKIIQILFRPRERIRE